MAKGSSFLRRWIWVVLGLAVGLALVALLVANRQSPGQGEAARDVPTLSVIEVQPLELRLVARGHGVARAAESWRATANVGGRVVERHPELESGNILPEGTELLALDPTRYRLAIAEAEAELASLDAEKRQLDTEEENTRELLALERERLDLEEKELERVQRLADRGQISRSARDKQRRATVTQRQAVAKLENELALIPTRRKQLQARREQARTRREQAREDLADTRFEAPYDLRVGEVDIELHDRASPGQLLFRADSTESAEVEAHVPLPMLRRVVGGVADLEGAPGALDLQERVGLQALDAQVVLAGVRDVRWRGRVTRIASGLDPTTRTVRVVVTVDAPYEKAEPPERPVLQPGMYVRVRLSAPSPEPRLVVPASAVHDGAVYLATGEDRLERRPVTVAFEQDDLAVIADGLAPGDRVIVDDPVPAVDGMAVDPRHDEALEEELRRRAEGAGA
ncbi:heavy metal transporter [Thiohalorhabdus denitrificans]|uniref:RND family efflux transporter, MFP subunit n=1 Tax=Thiohalorhabdus denitrificans TaxID=381306 RepID=A0A0P9ERQ1_9GAMM|nr:efflux RND transporter periplasmic adaptor subunit [Thiohalorhabdus denitrificans]KPV41196.1 heavy metal transporter [Thiohalorhabdus denitrificans]SCY63244.1 RND family efflux transporter, MFP subunit [Thiohalorhabdus denitrificans]